MSTLEQLRSAVLTSVYGRRLGIDQNDFLVGAKDIRVATQTIGSSTNSTASSTGTEILNYGITSLAAATETATTGSSYGTTEVGGVWALAAPVAGVEKLIYMASQHSTKAVAVACSTGVTIQYSSYGSSFGGIGFNAPGQYARLLGVSTSKWILMGIATGASAAAT